MWDILNKLLPPKMTDSIKGMRMYENSKGVVFDVPEFNADTITELYTGEK